MRTSYVIAVLLVTVLDVNSAVAQLVEEPGVRNAHGMAYHPVEDAVILFGGANESAVLNDTWAWKDSSWTRIQSDGPPARTFPAMIFDQNARGILLFGGNSVLFGGRNNSGTMLGDTWLYRDGAWTRIESKDAPPARAEAAMAYDASTRSALLFGGYALESGETVRLGDTWSWSPDAGWNLVASDGPSPRNGAAMVYDPGLGGVVLSGGSGGVSDTWIWRDGAWTEIAAASPPRFNAATSYHEAAGHLLRFGGWDGSGRVADTWRFDGTDWTQLPHAGPAARNHAVITYNAGSEKAILFGGHDGRYVMGDLWEWDASGWTQLIEIEPVRRVRNGH